MSQPSAVTLHDKAGLLISLPQWLRYQQDPDYRIIADTITFWDSWRLVTVWTGISYLSSQEHEGTIFETRVYRGFTRQVHFPSGAPRLTWATVEQALAGHWRAVSWLRWHIRAEHDTATRALTGL